MKRLVRGMAWLMLALLVLTLVVLVAGASWLAPWEHAVIHIDGDDINLVGFSGFDALFAVGGVLVAAAIVLLVLLVVVPLAVLLPLVALALATAFAVGLVLFAVFGVAALLLSPLLLFGWLVWRLVRGGKPAARMAT